jgi:uncharacterized protein YecT (DUF1311 family)
MKKFLILFFLLFLSISSYSQTQGEMNETSYKDYLKADKELNFVYKTILFRYAKNVEFIKALKESQRIWVNFRKAEINMKYPKSDGYGSSITMCVNSFAEDFTKQRTIYLKLWLKTQADNDMCGGSLRSYESD